MITKQKLQESLDKFINWLDHHGELSYDLNDFNSSRIGNFVRRIYYKNKILGSPFAMLALAQDIFFPSALKLYSKPHREAIGDAQYALGFLKLYKHSKDESYLYRAEHFLDELNKSAVPGYSGNCWGYTYGWQTTNGYWPPRTPVITVTPYCYWAFRLHHELTGNKDSYETCRSICEFVAKDLNRLDLPGGKKCYSYSPLDKRHVVNANSYRAAVLMDGFKLTGNPLYGTEAEISLDFVLSYQEANGMWWYDPIGTKDRFVDNFHTCFVLKSLAFCYDLDPSAKVLNSIEAGHRYYMQSLLNEDLSPKHFAVKKHNKLRKYEMYDFAEGIKVGCLLRDRIGNSYQVALAQAGMLIGKYQLRDGHFVTRVTTFGTKHKVPYHRWPQAQLFNALTDLLIKLSDS